MRLLYSQAALAFLSAFQVSAQLSQKVTVDNGKTVYIPTAGRTSSVAAPQFTPTVVYNCERMPLICENVAAWAIAQGNSNGDINSNQVFYFDPNTDDKDKRRRKACGCFKHDECRPSGTSNGKSKGAKVTDIASATATPLDDMSAKATDTLKAGPNPPPGQNRQPVSDVPGRFFKEGVAFSCDEYPPATFIEGGEGAKTICALQSWQIYTGSGNKNVGKWPLDSKSGRLAEQDWQATAHNFLRVALGVSGKKSQKGWGTVYPFSFTTTTLPTGSSSSKAWVVVSGPSTSVVTKRDLSPRTVAVPTATNLVVTGDEDVDRRFIRELELNFRPEGSPPQPLLAARTPVPEPEPKPRDIQLPSPVERPAFVPRALAALYPRALECSLDFDKEGREDIEVGDDGFDDLLPGDRSKPDCSEGDLISASDLQQINDELDERGNDAYNNCCGGGALYCGPIISQHGTAMVSLCGDQEQCIGCAQLANYIQGIIDTCSKDGRLAGQITQEVNERSGLTIEVDFSAR